jgi:hypothetical protein
MVGVNEGYASITRGEKVRKSPFGSHAINRCGSWLFELFQPGTYLQ